ncbi:MAG: C39 family peptidase [Lachnospiraceae bacterium]|nr:C39 family peptidase [Lachnospiraceae bacterium]
MKKGNYVTSLFLVLVLIINFSGLRLIAAQNSYSYVSVTPVQQLQTKWCWAACAEMAGKSKYPSSTRNQIHVVNHLYGTFENPYPNTGGYPDDMANGSTYVAYNTATFSYSYSTRTFSQITSSIVQGNPVIIDLGHYNFLGMRNRGHAIIVYGVYTGLNIVALVDPLDGEVYTCGFSNLQNGTYMTDYVYDHTIYI